MALTTFITYVSASGTIKSSQNREDNDAPSPGPGESVFDAGMQDPMPSPRTHRVDTAGPTLVAKTQGEIDTEENGVAKERYRENIATLESARSKYAPEGWDTTAIDQKIADLRAAHDALP